jgi:hypothetical protein
MFSSGYRENAQQLNYHMQLPVGFYRIKGGLLYVLLVAEITAVESLKRVTGRMFKIGK